MLVMVDSVREMTLKKLKCGEYRSFEHLLFLFIDPLYSITITREDHILDGKQDSIVSTIVGTEELSKARLRTERYAFSTLKPSGDLPIPPQETS